MEKRDNRDHRSTHATSYVLLLSIFVLVYPLAVYPAFLLDWAGQSTFVPNPELVHSIPRLLLLSVVSLLGWRFWQAHNAFSLLLLAFAVLVAASSLNANDPEGWNFTIWGPNRRMDGLVYQLLLVGLGVAVYGALLQAPERVATLQWSLLISGIIQTTLLVLQRLGADPIGPLIGGNQYVETLGTLGASGVAAGFLLPVLLVNLPLAWAPTNHRNSLLALLGVTMVAIGLGLTQNRSATYALLFVLALACLSGFAWRRLAICLALAGVTLLAPVAIPNTQGFAKSYQDTTTLEARFQIWRLALESLQYIRGEPWIGGGPDAFLLTLTRRFSAERLASFYRVEYRWPQDARVKQLEIMTSTNSTPRGNVLHAVLEQPDGHDTNWLILIRLDKAHNLFLDRFLAYGAFAMLIWALLFLYPLYLGIRNRVFLEHGPLFALLGLLVYYMAWFPVIQLEPIHLLLIAAAWVLVVGTQEARNLRQ